MVPEVGFPPIPPGTSFCEAARLAYSLLFLGLRFFVLLSVTFTALVCVALRVSSALTSMASMPGVVSAAR